MTAERLIRLRWAVRAVLTLGVTASVAANVLHAPTHPISQAIAAWPPIALLLTVELISRIPVHQRLLAAIRIIATTTIAGITAWISYWHMTGVAARYGETGASVYLLPLSVDGLIVVASISLVEISARLTTVTPTTTTPAVAACAADTERAIAMPAATPPSHPAASAVAAHNETPTADGSRPPKPDYTPAPLRTRPDDPNQTPAPRRPAKDAAARAASSLYQPTNAEDAAMYQAWLAGMEQGHEPSGADLARATGRADDATGTGRRAARRYRQAHATRPTTNAATAAGHTARTARVPATATSS
ncbi:DUF2637 domain-containing protein [Paractinoplanes rishiriensis]|uniref:DUF2637 domain-containing protein n=1 Tax=Paractinoplanes rishiriensis TaxID=1050105 RepID=A0A919KCZ0_9ACTN|nr:DUF2637 domain-containing protein [Actinoplanes rishiriensis]GIF01592.1 hypothetical protein Ari01nite_90560 [Actinoplanes rishiriensis]